MLNILINAYAVSPSWGSEQGVGWNWIINIAKYSNCFVITESEYQNEIERTVANHPLKEHLHFYFNPVTPEVRKMCWNQGDYRFYIYYEQWQRRTLEIALNICSMIRIDVIHHLGMVCFREPGYLWQIDDIPFVWGPVCGMEDVPLHMLPEIPTVQKIKYTLKNLVSGWQRRYMSRVVKAIKRSSYIMASTRTTFETIERYHHFKNLVFINETGTDNSQGSTCIHEFTHDTLNLIWVGRFLNTKKLNLALETISLLKDVNVRLIIVGTGTDSEVEYYKNYAEKLGVSKMVSWKGKVPNSDVKKMMQEADLLFMTSVVEATSTVVPEAITNNLPILCFNACGFGHLVKDRVGETIEMISPSQAASEFAQKIKYLNTNRDILKYYSEACDNYKYELSWEWKAQKCVELYEKAIKEFHKV